MGKKIPDAFLQQLREIPIEEVAGLYFDLKQVNNLYQTSCIHGSDSGPSLTFFTETNTFYCFGCGAGKRPKTDGSDVISFVMWVDKCSFTEAIHKIANFKGLTIPKEGLSPEEKKQIEMIAKVTQQNRDYWNHLQKEERAIKYLNERGINQEDIDKWRIGYIPENISSYHAGKVVFALMNSWGQTVGFSHRDMTKEFKGEKLRGPKYINSPKSPIFDKGNTLYGLNFVKRLIREKGYAVVGEGFGDTILGQKLGLPFVSIMGTSLTDNHIRILKEHTNTVILWMDGDAGGIGATMRHAKALREAGFLVKIINYLGKDPDDIFMDAMQSNTFEEACQITGDIVQHKSILASQFEINQIMAKVNSDILEIKLNACKTILPILDEMEEGLEKVFVRRNAAEQLGVTLKELGLEE